MSGKSNESQIAKQHGKMSIAHMAKNTTWEQYDKYSIAKKYANSIRKIACQNVILSYGKHSNKFSITNASRQKVNLTHGKKDNMEKTSARKIHHCTKTWQIQHDKEKGRNMNLSQSREYVQCSSYSGTLCT